MYKNISEGSPGEGTQQTTRSIMGSEFIRNTRVELISRLQRKIKISSHCALLNDHF